MLCKLFLHSYLTCFVNNLVADVRRYLILLIIEDDQNGWPASSHPTTLPVPISIAILGYNPLTTTKTSTAIAMRQVIR